MPAVSSYIGRDSEATSIKWNAAALPIYPRRRRRATMQAPKIAPGVFDVSIHQAMRIHHVPSGLGAPALPSARHQRRQAKTQRVVEQQIREQSLLKFVTVRAAAVRGR